jgi:hypothetical protein
MKASSAKSWAGSAANLLPKPLHRLHPSRHVLHDRPGAATEMAVRNAANAVLHVANAVNAVVSAAAGADVASAVNAARVVNAKVASAVVMIGSVGAVALVKSVRRSRASNNVHLQRLKPLMLTRPILRMQHR